MVIWDYELHDEGRLLSSTSRAMAKGLRTLYDLPILLFLFPARCCCHSHVAFVVVNNRVFVPEQTALAEVGLGYREVRRQRQNHLVGLDRHLSEWSIQGVVDQCVKTLYWVCGSKLN